MVEPTNFTTTVSSLVKVDDFTLLDLREPTSLNFMDEGISLHTDFPLVTYVFCPKISTPSLSLSLDEVGLGFSKPDNKNFQKKN